MVQRGRKSGLCWRSQTFPLTLLAATPGSSKGEAHVTRNPLRFFWAALMAALFGLAFWKNSRSYPRKFQLWRPGGAVIDTGLADQPA